MQVFAYVFKPFQCYNIIGSDIEMLLEDKGEARALLL